MVIRVAPSFLDSALIDFPDSSVGRNLPAVPETLVQFLGQEDLLEKGSILGLPLWLSWSTSHLQCGRPGFDPRFGKIPWGRERLPTPVFWPGEFHGLYSPWGRKETRLSNFHFHFKRPWWLRWYSVCLQCRRPGFDLWVRKIPWRRKWQPTPVLLPGESHGWRSLQSMGSQRVGHDLMTSLSISNKRCSTETRSSFYHTRLWQKGIGYEPGRELLPEPDNAGTLILFFPDCRTVRNNILFINYSQWYFIFAI